MGMSDMIQYFRQKSSKLGSNIYAGIQGHSNPQQISFMRQLQKEMRAKNNLETPLKDLEFVVFDLETTGFYPEKGDQIISIGAVKMKGADIEDQETSSFYSLVKSNVPLTEQISMLTNIKDEELASAPEAKDVLIQFFKFTGSSILVAHHSSHEHSFMQKITWDLMKTRFEHRLIDTTFLIRLANPNIKTITLEEACLECGVKIKDRHHALGDAKMTAKIWSYYLKKAQTMGIENLQEVYENLAKM